MKITVIGNKAAEKRINEISRNLRNFNPFNNDFKRELLIVADHIRGQSQKVTPVDTGKLRQSVRIMPLSGLTPRVEIAPHTDYAFFVHEGTRKMRPRPFMFWGISNSGRAIEAFAKKTGKNLSLSLVK